MLVEFRDGFGFVCATCHGLMATPARTMAEVPELQIQTWRQQMQMVGWETIHHIDFDLCPHCKKIANN